MQTYEIIVSGRAVRANSADTTLVRTSVGIDKIHVLFDNEEWRSFPVRVTFANGSTLVSTSVTLTALDSTEWAAEAECTIPWEVIQTLGGIRITFQGTDSSGKHIITEASGTPLTVVEAGDVVDGSAPQPAPTVDEWHQAYADAMAAASDAASAAEQVAEILHSTDAQTLEELIAALGSAIRYKGSVATYADLPDDAEPGDMYNVAAAYGDYPAGTNWAWTVDETWDALGGEIDLSIFAPLASPALTGTPTAPTAATGTDTTQIATTAFVQQEIGAQDVATTTDDGLMSAADKAKLDGIEAQANKVTAGDGLTLADGSLSLGPLVREGNPTHGCALYAVDAQGWAEQDGTPTPESPVPIEVARGRNLLPNNATSQTINGVTFTANADGSVTANGTATANAVVQLPTLALDAGTYTMSALYGAIENSIANAYVWGNGQALARDSSNPNDNPTFTLSKSTNVAFLVRVMSGKTVSNLTFYPQLELGSTPTPYVPYGHVGLEVQGRNLAQNDLGVLTTNGITFTPQDDGGIRITGTASANAFYWMRNPNAGIPLAVETYAASVDGLNTSNIVVQIGYYTQPNGDLTYLWSTTVAYQSFEIPEGVYGVGWRIYVKSGATVNATVKLQIELGTTPTEYEPYLHETRAIPLPLESDGERWAGGLPDGTADALSVDSAGRWTWELPVGKYDITGAESVTSEAQYTTYRRAVLNGALSAAPAIPASGSSGLCTNAPYGDGLATDALHVTANGVTLTLFAIAESGADVLAEYVGAELLYHLATPTTEEGYIDLPDLPDGAVVSIPELEDVGVSWFVAGAKELVKHAANWHKREDMASRLAALEATVAELATS